MLTASEAMPATWGLADASYNPTTVERLQTQQIRYFTENSGRRTKCGARCLSNLNDRKISESATAPRLILLGCIVFPHVAGCTTFAVNMGLC